MEKIISLLLGNVSFGKSAGGNNSKGWTLDIINCIEKLNKIEFSLQDIYFFEEDLQLKYPNNKFVKDKIRQQLQILRDKNYLEFVNKGTYRLVTNK